MPRNVALMLALAPVAIGRPARHLRRRVHRRALRGHRRGTTCGVARAVAASSAVPGLFTPQPILDRRCMDGGVSGTGTHLDLVAGARRAVVLNLTDGAGAQTGALTSTPTAVVDELAALEASGTEVFHRMPETMDILTLMDPAAVPDAIAMGERQAAADADRAADLPPVASASACPVG